MDTRTEETMPVSKSEQAARYAFQFTA